MSEAGVEIETGRYQSPIYIIVILICLASFLSKLIEGRLGKKMCENTLWLVAVVLGFLFSVTGYGALYMTDIHLLYFPSFSFLLRKITNITMLCIMHCIVVVKECRESFIFLCHA